jgi:transcription-repair coupling factor (superfamily II helicase)
VIEAVAELNGQTIEQPTEIKLDLPVAANLPESYVAAESQRLEAYRRLAAVRSADEVSDIRAEWEDRYGPVPEPAERLLDVALLRASCARVGVREVIVIKGPGFGGPEQIAKLGPVKLKTSQEIRFSRLFSGGVWKPAEYGGEGGQLQVGLMKRGSAAVDLVTFFETMFPPEDKRPEGEKR